MFCPSYRVGKRQLPVSFRALSTLFTDQLFTIRRVVTTNLIAQSRTPITGKHTQKHIMLKLLFKSLHLFAHGSLHRKLCFKILILFSVKFLVFEDVRGRRILYNCCPSLILIFSHSLFRSSNDARNIGPAAVVPF